MKRRRSYSSAINPFALWMNVAIKSTEMLTASAQVISHRTQRMAAAGPAPNARDRREFTLMGQEKIAAAAQSAGAITAQLAKTNSALGTTVLQQMFGNAAAWMSLAQSRTPAQLFARQAALAQSLTRSTTTLNKMSASVARVAQQGMQPIHSKATANARRLAKR